MQPLSNKFLEGQLTDRLTDAEFEQWAHNLVTHFPSATSAINYYRELRARNRDLQEAVDYMAQRGLDAFREETERRDLARLIAKYGVPND